MVWWGLGKVDGQMRIGEGWWSDEDWGRLMVWWGLWKVDGLMVIGESWWSDEDWGRLMVWWGFGRVDGQFLHALWWLWSLILAAQTLVWAWDDWEAVCSFCLLHLCRVIPLPQTYSWLFWLKSTNYVSLPWLVVDSCQHKLWFQLVFVMFSWSAMIILSFLEFAEEDCFGHVCVLHPCDVATDIHLAP